MESFLANLRHDVQCSLCNDTVIDPKLLECFHTFCKPCIKRKAELIGIINIFKCPKCCSETLLGELSSVDDLPPSPVHARIVRVLEFVETDQVCSASATHSPALWYCFDCNRLLCDECLSNHSVFNKEHKVASSSDLKNVQDLEAILTRESICKTHSSQSMDLYCKDCEVLICRLCLKDGHKDHKTLTLQEITAIKKDLLSKNLDLIEKLQCNAKEKKQQEEIALKIKSDGEKAKEQVQNATKKLVKILLDHEKQLLNEIQRSVAKADRNLRVIRHIPATQEYIRNILEKGLVSEMVDIQQEDSSNKCTYNPFKRESSGIVFDPNKELSQQVNAGLGKVRLSCKSDPMLSTMQVDGHLEALKKTKLTVETKTSAGELNNEPSDDVDVQIRPEDDVKVEERKMTSGGKIEVQFIPQVAGQLTAQVQVNGNAVSNSPLVMDVKPQHMEEIAGDSKLKSALNTGSRSFSGIAVNKTNSRIAVADCRSHCVRVFNMDGDLLLTYGSKGSGQGQLYGPDGLAFLNETDLVIVDCGNNRICIVNTITGTLLKIFGCNGNGQFSYPHGVHVDDNCNIVVTDTGLELGGVWLCKQPSLADGLDSAGTEDTTPYQPPTFIQRSLSFDGKDGTTPDPPPTFIQRSLSFDGKDDTTPDPPPTFIQRSLSFDGNDDNVFTRSDMGKDSSSSDDEVNSSEEDKTSCWLQRAMSLCSEGGDIEVLASEADNSEFIDELNFPKPFSDVEDNEPRSDPESSRESIGDEETSPSSANSSIREASDDPSSAVFSAAAATSTPYNKQTTSIAAANVVRNALSCELDGQYKEAFHLYKKCVSLLLNGVQEEKDTKRRDAVRRKTAQYLLKAEALYTAYIHDTTKLLTVTPSERLGHGVNGVDDIKTHPFFSEMDWTSLDRQRQM
ncbi:hypothetical protein QZH41_006928 [Actinostola sp. cb2023]|nr:hypothetical protein QZH41_006928 [Actinostola sp. cb2023]